MNYFLGYDFGSSSVKVALTTPQGIMIAAAQYPAKEMSIQSPHPGWAEQDPEAWWKNCQKATQILLKKADIPASKIKSIGISYQMHGLVAIDSKGKVLRPAVIWCDSRAVATGDKAMTAIGKYCMDNCLNLPGNFTASKLRWMIENEPEIVNRIFKIMLPGDYIAYRMTGETTTTIAGLSEGIMWDFKNNEVSGTLLDYYQIPKSYIPPIVPCFGFQGKLSSAAANYLGLQEGTVLSYRAGDQPNNAMSLNVLNPGQVAATGGTSGVVYAVSGQLTGDSLQKTNSFAHVNHSKENPRIGVLLCINGAGILYSWMRSITGRYQSYDHMEKAATLVDPGSEGLIILPFGNGVERILGNISKGAQMNGIDFNRHTKAHLYRAALEGIAFTFVYGMKSLSSLGVQTNNMRVGNDNLFQSTIFSSTIATLMDCQIDILETTGATGAAMGGQYGAGFSDSLEASVSTVKLIKSIEPENAGEKLEAAYHNWLEKLKNY